MPDKILKMFVLIAANIRARIEVSKLTDSTSGKFRSKRRRKFMLNCEYCDYLENASEGCYGSGMKNNASCKLSEHIFIEGEMESETEYPCRDISYQDYLNRSEAHTIKSAFNRDRRNLHIKKGRIPAGRRLPIAG